MNVVAVTVGVIGGAIVIAIITYFVVKHVRSLTPPVEPSKEIASN